MKFNTDSHFVIGHSHVKQNKPCQDHALDTSLDSGSAGVAVVSDGCSSGDYKDNDNKKVIHTDIGARVITCSVMNTVNRFGGWDYSENSTPRYMMSTIVDNALNSKQILSLKNDDMLATCSYACVMEQGGFVHLIGDGCVAIKFRNGEIAVTSLNWQSNMPFYLGYIISGKTGQFIDKHEAAGNGRQALKVSQYGIFKSGTAYGKDMNDYHIAAEDGISGYRDYISPSSLQLIESIAIFSDGISDFQNIESKTTIPEHEIITQMMAFKGYKGEFVRRRMSSALKDLAKAGIYPNDDFSMSVIHVDHEEVNNG